jgi:acyl-CoA thioester hydrolase
MEFQTVARVKVPFRDVDMLGHVNNAVYLSYLETARTEFWERHFGVDGYMRMPYILGDMYIRYKAPARIREVLDLEIRFASLGNRSFVFEYQVRNGDTGAVVAEARSTQVMFQLDTGDTFPIPDELRLKAAELGLVQTAG